MASAARRLQALGPLGEKAHFAVRHLPFDVLCAWFLLAPWNHPEAIAEARTRCEVACVVCARKDWLENRFRVYLGRDATNKRTYTELQHTDSGTSKLLTCGEIL